MATKIDEKTFTSLCSKDKTGKIRNWNIKVINYSEYSDIIILQGYIRQVETSIRIYKGKNIGKKNETTHFEQGISQATSKWKKKIEEGYTKTCEIILENKDKCIEPVITISKDIKYPMLALEYIKNKSKIKFPVFMQPKLDGYRMIFDPKSQTMTSRTGKQSFNIIKKSDLYNELCKLPNEYIYDGELYIHNREFERLGVLRKKLSSKITEKDLQNIYQIEYHIYDIIDEKLSFLERNKIIQNIFNKNRFIKIKNVDTVIVNDFDTLNEYHVNVVNELNYEGSIIRNMDSLYKCKSRSDGLLKYKNFIDAEYPIVNFTFETDTTVDADNPLVVWVCQTPEHKTFNIRPKGTKEERQLLYKRGSEFIGKKLWVKFFELTDFNIPRFPTTKTNTYKDYIRDVVL
jgi:ATP-dependent DNA ligase